MAADATMSMNNLAGQWLESFQLVRLLGTGAMGVVYLAKDSVLRRDVAIKLIARGTADTDPERRERFLREARAAARLLHPNVVQIFQVGEHDEYRFIAMEYVEGMTTSRAAKLSGGRLPEQTAIEKMREAADALKLAGSFGICHRDIKPANLLLTSSGALKIADFGLASHVEGSESIGPGSSSQLEGTPFYMSPEQWTGGPVAPSADIYSLGCTFYHLFVGHTPYGARDLIGCFQAHCLSPVPDPKAALPDIDPLLSDLLRRCMAKRPEERPTAAHIVELLDDMLLLRRSAIRSRGAIATTPSPPPGETMSATMDQTTQTRTAGQTSRSWKSEGLGRQTYHEFFGFQGHPFSDNRQPASFWDSGPYAWALRTLASQIAAGQKLTMLLGGPGSGRTFVCEMIRNKFPRIHMFSVEPQLLFGQRLLVSLCKQLGAASVSPSASQRFLGEVFLAQALPKDRPETIAAVVVDGVDANDQELMIELDDILRNAPPSRFSLVLVGPEDLPGNLITQAAPPSITTGAPPVVLRPMTQEEMMSYIHFRMKSVGGASQALNLDIAAQQLLHARSGGNPKLVNIYCHNALTIASMAKERDVRLSLLRAAMKAKTYLTPETALSLLRGG